MNKDELEINPALLVDALATQHATIRRYRKALEYLLKWISQDQTGITKEQIVNSVANQCSEALEGAE